MKKTNSLLIKISFVFLLISGSMLAQAKNSSSFNYSIQQDTIQQTPTVCYEVFGMDCPGCESALEKQIKKLEGIEKVEASWEKQQVLIWVDKKNQPTEAEITKRIKKANFTPVEKIKPKKDEK